MIRAVLIAALFTVAVPAAAIDTEADFDNPAMQARYERLIGELRCLVCQNNSIADSNATLASDLRREVHAMLVAGKSDEDILKFMTDRYGDFVLYKPPMAPRTWLLWFAPVLLLGIGGIVAWRIVARRSQLVGGDTDDGPDAGENSR